jgi:lipopolysaccharide export system protein LptC
MSDTRTSSYRIRLVLFLALVIALALGSFWVLDVMRRSLEEAMPPSLRTDPDYYVENFTFVRLGETGKVRYHVSGNKLVHNPRDDTYDIQQPVVTSVSQSRPPLTVHAMRGHGDPKTNAIELYDKVRVDRPASATTQYFHMSTDYLYVLPDEEIMKTHLPVQLISGTAVLNGVGMVANQATREFSLAKQVHGVYPPPHE